MSTAEMTIALIAASDGEVTTDETRALYDEIVRAWHLGPTGVLSALADIGVSAYAPARIAELEEGLRHAEDSTTEYSERLGAAESRAEEIADERDDLVDHLRDLVGSWREQAAKLYEAADNEAESGADSDESIRTQAEAEGAATALDDAAAELVRLLPTGK